MDPLVLNVLYRYICSSDITSVIRKEKGEYCVRSPNNPDWSGGCFKSKEKAEDRLRQVEYFKHKSSIRVARRFIAGLKDQLESKMRDLLDEPLSASKGKEIGAWLEANFNFNIAKTPKGGKALKDELGRLSWWLKYGIGQQQNPEVARATIDASWGKIRSNLDALVNLFSEEGSRVVPREKRVGSNLYMNLSGLPEETLDKYVVALEQVFDELKGWRKKALAGGLKVAFAGPTHFRGTSAGKYKSEDDILYVRATPKILKRTRGTYGAFDYIIVHELGHRYDHKRHPGIDFDRAEWYSSPYSRNGGGEPFAELFAISNFDIKGPWNQAVVDKFEDYMSTGKIPESEPVEIPPHLLKFRENQRLARRFMDLSPQ